MSSINVKNASNETFNEEIGDNSVVVDFWAPWCGPCKVLSPIIEDLAKQYDGKVKVLKVNIEDSPELARKHNISGIPTIITYKEGEEEKRVVGFKGRAVLEDLFEDLV